MVFNLFYKNFASDRRRSFLIQTSLTLRCPVWGFWVHLEQRDSNRALQASIFCRCSEGTGWDSLLQPEWIHFYFFYRLAVWSDFIWRVASTALQALKITGPQCAFSRNSGSTVWVNTHYPKDGKSQQEK